MIVFAHLLNDASGSPRVLHSVITALTQSGHDAKLYIGSDGNGCLSDSGIPITRYWYYRSPYRLVTLITFLLSQVFLFFRLLNDRSIEKNAVIYVNTLLPFGAALYGRMTGRKVIYHVHEVSITPAPLRWLLIGIVRWTSSLNIYVSDAHIKTMPISGVSACRIHNALDSEFSRKAAASTYSHRNNGQFNVLMVASLRDYKGVPELLKLAAALGEKSEVHFDLLVNDDQEAIERYFRGKKILGNLTIHSRVMDTTPFYKRANLVVNLSRVDQWVETFGMTVLEAMAFGIPVIAPPVGGPAELVYNESCGYLIDSRDHALLYNKLVHLNDDSTHCYALSKECAQRSRDFSFEMFRISLHNAITKVLMESENE